jgi:hypothetical protein
MFKKMAAGGLPHLASLAQKSAKIHHHRDGDLPIMHDAWLMADAICLDKEPYSYRCK